MTVFDAVILGSVEGITEFLPISSTAHLIMTSRFLGLPQTEAMKSFEIMIQGGAILAVLVVSVRSLFSDRHLIGKTVVAFVPTSIAGLLLYPIVKNVFLENYFIIPIALIVGGIVMIVFERKKVKTPHEEDKEDLSLVSYRHAFLIGCAQILALIPGVSRSATTVVAGRMLGLSKQNIVKFSFFLAIPTIGAATAYDYLKNVDSMKSSDLVLIFVGFAVSFVVAYIALSWLLRYVRAHSFERFGWYRIVIGAIFLVALIL